VTFIIIAKIGNFNKKIRLLDIITLIVNTGQAHNPAVGSQGQGA
jgi:hypothetical protein